MKERIEMYLRSREFNWTLEQREEFRREYGKQFGTFGSSPYCWNRAIKQMAEHLSITL